MKTVILCGGKGTRLKEETEYRPKPLVEIGGKPILWHIMKIYDTQGFNDFVLCLGYKGNMIKDYFLNLKEMSNDFMMDLKNKETETFSNNESLKGKVWFVDTGLNSQTGSRVARIKKYVEKDEDFFLTYGDGVSDVNIQELYEYHKKMDRIATITAVKPPYRFGLIELCKDKGLVKKFDEKPDMTDMVINGGFMVFKNKIFDYLSENENCILEKDALEKLTTERQLAAYEHKGFWKCMDNQKEVDELNKIYQEGAPWETWK
ncbi:MAG: glucose-1-phosphate cytidylyltransferase [Candidatus Nanoarchaeia archaeon]|nr:glucose-1-phosphate cytidylyltransferase [Candidatus Nanoarchaeia archaeon]MDD5358115.1 glucose-1-phosphate cytidylyltransferase [Candidatus Nanoarchaeia archaeon]MDD5589302.1 glucose-1-phosphate cytidylyltransferase [Candidatus Nanoarchaeia archaeon]